MSSSHFQQFLPRQPGTMSNCSTCLSEESLWRNFSQYCIYIVQGAFLAVSNLLVFAAIARQPMLRIKKEYIVVAGLSFINGANGIATLIGGLGRNIYIYLGTANVLITRWQCFLAPWNLIWQLAHCLTTVMLLVCSLDRLYAVQSPLSYFKADWRYAMVLVGAGYGYALGQMFVGALMTYWHSYKHPDDLVPQTCMMGWSSNPYYHAYLSNQRLICSGLSVFLYIAVFYIYHKSKNKISSTARNAQQDREQKKQRKITMSLGVSAFVTLVFFFLPLVVELFSNVIFRFPPDAYTTIGAYIQLLTNMDSFLDFFIFTLRHREVKMAVQYLFRCKQMSAVQIAGGPIYVPQAQLKPGELLCALQSA